MGFRRLENFLKGAALAGALFGSARENVAEAKPPQKIELTRASLPALPLEFGKLHDKQNFNNRAFALLETYFGIRAGGATRGSLDEETTRALYHGLRLCFTGLRNRLVGLVALDENQKNQLAQFRTKLRAKGIDLPTLQNIIDLSADKDRAVKMYEEARALYDTSKIEQTEPDKAAETSTAETTESSDEPESASPPHPTVPAKEMPPETLAEPETTPIPGTSDGRAEKRALPRGAFGFDKWGYPYGWNFITDYIQSEADIPKPEELSEPFDTREVANKRGGEPDIKRKNGQLRKEAYEGLMELKRQFDKAAEHNAALKEIGFWVTEALRDHARQVMLRKKLGTQAAIPGRSEHELGVAVDLRMAKYEPMVYFLFGTPDKWHDPNYIPPLFDAGFIITMRNEPMWHIRHVGRDRSVPYLKEYREQIIKAMSTKINAWPPRQK